MTHLANIFGYLAGYINLTHWSGISWVGGGQFRKLAVISCTVMVICVSITCWTQDERPKEGGLVEEKGMKWGGILKNIRESIRDLPLPVRRVCYGKDHIETSFISMHIDQFLSQYNFSHGQPISPSCSIVQLGLPKSSTPRYRKDNHLQQPTLLPAQGLSLFSSSHSSPSYLVPSYPGSPQSVNTISSPDLIQPR